MSGPNIILIIADDMGYGDFGIFNDQISCTPHLDALVGEGVTLTQHYSGLARLYAGARRHDDRALSAPHRQHRHPGSAGPGSFAAGRNDPGRLAFERRLRHGLGWQMA